VKHVLLILVSLSLVGCGEPTSTLEEGVTARVTRVIAATPQSRDIEYVLSALGSVESISDPTVSAETAGQVREIAVREGDAVEMGQLLAALDGTLHEIESAKAEAELRRHEVLLENQSNEVKRLRRLDESQSVSRDKLEDEQAQLEMLRAQRDVARKQWEQALYLQSKTRIEAPLNGLVSRRHISPGDYVTSGQPLFELVSVDTLRARIAFPEHDASRVAIGKKVELTSPAAPGVIAVGAVTAVNPQIKIHNRALEVTVEFANPGGWLPGASTDATLVVEKRKGALTLPGLAVVRRNGRDVVFVIDKGRATAVEVTQGWREDDWIEISQGLAITDLVVVEGAGQISDGSLVEIESEVESAAP
jgi:membrane fusion protein (multidrug efflux system)